jgi:hypothetical protein
MRDRMEEQVINDLEQNISEKMNGDELIKLLNNTCDITPYSRIKQYRNVDEMLGNYKQTIILYEYEPRSGHWVVLYRNNKNKLCFYDSLGNKVDELNKDINKFRSNMGIPLVNNDLKNLIGFEKVINNTTEIQEDSEEVNTCGCYCVARLLLKQLDNKQFNTLFKNGNEYSPDYFVRYFIDNILRNN